jgi:hypothetical protein
VVTPSRLGRERLGRGTGSAQRPTRRGRPRPCGAWSPAHARRAGRSPSAPRSPAGRRGGPRDRPSATTGRAAGSRPGGLRRGGHGALRGLGMVGGGRRHIGPPVTAQVKTDDRAPVARSSGATDLDPLITEASEHRAILSAHTLRTGRRRRLGKLEGRDGLGTARPRGERVRRSPWPGTGGAAPGRILPGKPLDQGGDGRVDWRTTACVRVGPFLGHQATMPAQDGGRGDQAVTAQVRERHRLSAASTARSAQSRRGLGFVLRSTATS